MVSDFWDVLRVISLTCTYISEVRPQLLLLVHHGFNYKVVQATSTSPKHWFGHRLGASQMVSVVKLRI